MSLAAYNTRQYEIRRHVTGVLNFAHARSLTSEGDRIAHVRTLNRARASLFIDDFITSLSSGRRNCPKRSSAIDCTSSRARRQEYTTEEEKSRGTKER